MQCGYLENVGSKGCGDLRDEKFKGSRRWTGWGSRDVRSRGVKM